jgi:hypothetical protein
VIAVTDAVPALRERQRASGAGVWGRSPQGNADGVDLGDMINDRKVGR